MAELNNLLKALSSLESPDEVRQSRKSEALTAAAAMVGQPQGVGGAILKGLLAAGGVKAGEKADDAKLQRMEKLRGLVELQVAQQQKLQQQKQTLETITKNREALDSIISLAMAHKSPEQRALALKDGIKNLPDVQAMLGQDDIVAIQDDGTAILAAPNGSTEVGSNVLGFMSPSARTASAELRMKQAQQDRLTAEAADDVVIKLRDGSEIKGIREQRLTPQGVVSVFKNLQGVEIGGGEVADFDVIGAIQRKEDIGQTPEQKFLAEQSQGRLTSLFESTASLREQQPQIDQITNALREGAVTSPVSGIIAAVNGIGQLAGVDLGLAGGASLEDIRRAGNQLVLAASGGLGKAISDGDRKFLEDSFANISTSVEGNLQAIDAFNQIEIVTGKH